MSYEHTPKSLSQVRKLTPSIFLPTTSSYRTEGARVRKRRSVLCTCLDLLSQHEYNGKVLAPLSPVLFAQSSTRPIANTEWCGFFCYVLLHLLQNSGWAIMVGMETFCLICSSFASVRFPESGPKGSRRHSGFQGTGPVPLTICVQCWIHGYSAQSPQAHLPHTTAPQRAMHRQPACRAGGLRRTSR